MERHTGIFGLQEFYTVQQSVYGVHKVCRVLHAAVMTLGLGIPIGISLPNEAAAQDEMFRNGCLLFVFEGKAPVLG